MLNKTPSSNASLDTGMRSTFSENSDKFIAGVLLIGHFLQNIRYSFTTITPASHQRLIDRNPEREAIDFRGAFGWNLPFKHDLLPTGMLKKLSECGIVVPFGRGWRSSVRFSTIGEHLYVHDGFPTLSNDAVFFGPDTYRFVNAVRRQLKPCELLIDICCGSGAGGIEVAERASHTVMCDINPRSIACATANGQLNRILRTSCQIRDLLGGEEYQRPDAIIANPPYMADSLHRSYRDGGGHLGVDLSICIVDQALRRLTPGGQLLLYTGTPIINGLDIFAQEVLPRIAATADTWSYEEIDPDVFGEELLQPAYQCVERIAVVLLDLTMRR